MDWQCLQWGDQFSAGRLVGRIPSCSHWIIALNHSTGSHSKEVHSTIKHLLLPLTDIMQDLKFYLSRSLFDFFFLFSFFFFHPLQAPEHQMSALKPSPKSIIQCTVWCQDTSSCRVKFCFSDCADADTKIAQDTKAYKHSYSMHFAGLLG